MSGNNLINILIPSNIESYGRVNYTNDFEMPLTQPLDGLNNHAFIEVLNVLYPKTISNLKNDDCFYSLTLNFEDLSTSEPVELSAQYLIPPPRYAKFTYNGCDSTFLFETGKIGIKNGIYSLKELLNVMNNRLEEYGVKLKQSGGKKINLTWNSFFEIWIKQNKTDNIYFSYDKTRTNVPIPKKFEMYPDKSFDGGDIDVFHPYNYESSLRYPKSSKFTDNYYSTIKMTLHLSNSLKYILGFSENDISFTSKIVYKTKKFYDNIFSIEGDYLPDIKNAVSNMYIYCDQLESMIVGNSNAELLCIIPVEKDQGSGETVSYAPPGSLRKKFKKNYIDKLNITIKDAAGNPISFDYGTVNIEALIHYV